MENLSDPSIIISSSDDDTISNLSINEKTEQLEPSISEEPSNKIKELMKDELNEESEIETISNEQKIKELMKTDFDYPTLDDPELQYKLYKKREFYINRIPEKPLIKNYSDVKDYRDEICGRDEFKLSEHQVFLSNFMNPNTPYRGLLLFHGMGTGKCTSKSTIVCINNKKISQEDIWYKYRTNLILDKSGGFWSKPSQQLSIYSYNNIVKAIVKRDVNWLYRESFRGKLRVITLENGLTIETTVNHKLLTKNGWSKDLKLNDLIYIYQDNECSYSYIKRIEFKDYEDFVYDLEIDVEHNYVADGFITHNTCAGISIAETFKDMIKKYNTKIHILVPGPIIKNNWKNELLTCTGETYLKHIDKTVYRSKEEEENLKKVALIDALQNYKILSFKSFYKRVLGEKIQDKHVVNKTNRKIVYRKTEEGEFERDVSVDRIYNLNNTLLIVDEAHGLTGNQYGEALRIIIKNSVNLRVLLLSGTPMKNLADDIVDLLNFIRPLDAQIDRNKIFDSNVNYNMKIIDGGIEYFKKMATGYVSHIRGGDPLIFAKRVDKGIMPKELKITKIIQCHMSEFQTEVYNNYIKTIKEEEDSLDRKSESVANFIFPALDPNKSKIIGVYGREGIGILREQLRNNSNLLNKLICNMLKIKENNEMLYLSSNGKTITGNIMKKEYLKTFSTKFYRALIKLNKLVVGKRGPKTAFIYSNLVKVGINIFQEILLNNGYLEFDETQNYKIHPDTKCYLCGENFNKHSNQHLFKPATFITVTGKSTEESADFLPEDKQNIINNYFNNVDNNDGKNIKFILGSRVINEGISFKNVGEVHILDVSFNFGRVDQVIARAIRHCSHYSMMNEKNKFPKVNVFKYAIVLDNDISSEVNLYKKAELKYLLIKKIERAMKEVAIDCPLNMSSNVFKEEIEKYKDCKDKCPMICDYTDCDYKCNDVKLNAEFYDPSRKIYRKIPKNKLDYSTFTQTPKFALTEINFAKDKIKEMFLFKYIYTLREILIYVKNSYDINKRELFDDFFVFKALDELLPITENDFNNFKDTITDKYNEPGYLIYVNKYYIFQPFSQNENVTMYYRTKYNKEFKQTFSLYNYLKNNIEYKKFKITKKKEIKLKDVSFYDFDSVMDYYNNKKEFDYVGIIDSDVGKKQHKLDEEINDVFKIREKRDESDKKRGVGILTLKGAVCNIAKNKEYLNKVCKFLDISINKESRETVCDKIKEKLLYLEKYATGKNKLTYIIIPLNHSIYPFPYNLEDRIEFIKEKIRKLILDFDDFKLDKSKGKEPTYKLTIKQNKKTLKYENELKNLGGKFLNDEIVFDFR